MAASVDNYERLSSFCYKGLEPSLPHFWSSASLKLELDGTDYQVKLNADLIGKYATFFSGLHWIQSDIGGKACPGKRNCLDLHSGRVNGLVCNNNGSTCMNSTFSSCPGVPKTLS